MECWNDGFKSILSFWNKAFSAFGPIFPIFHLSILIAAQREQLLKANTVSIHAGEQHQLIL